MVFRSSRERHIWGRGRDTGDMVNLLLTRLYEKCPDIDLTLSPYPGTKNKTKYHERKVSKPKKAWKGL